MYAFDGDWLTNYQYEKPDGGWIGLDLGTPQTIDRVRCIPRSDDNWVRPGDIYELKYWHLNKWCSLGVKQADRGELCFESVPSNALLWLHNLTRGQEERIFMYEKGRQVWW